MRIFIKLIDQTIYSVDVASSDTIGNVAQKIEEMGIPVTANQLRLVYKGKILRDDSTTVESNNIKEDETLSKRG